MIGAIYLLIGVGIAWKWRRHFNDREFWAVAAIIVLLWGPLMLGLSVTYAALVVADKVKQWR